jgi:hypothetical protein
VKDEGMGTAGLAGVGKMGCTSLSRNLAAMVDVIGALPPAKGKR